ncbi:Copper transporter 2 [Glycine max]|nr:Copper transporter 2 [Glycine max]
MPMSNGRENRMKIEDAHESLLGQRCHSNFLWVAKAQCWYQQEKNVLVVFFLAMIVEPNIKCGTNPIKGGLVQASYYVFRISFLYLVKLVVMSFNLGIFIVVVAGHTLGFFLAKSHALALANREQESFSDAQKV